MINYLRHKIGQPPALSPFGPKPENHPTVGVPCLACWERFRAGDYTTVVPLGPGIGSDEERLNAREGRWFTAVAIELHYACATGANVGPSERAKETP